MNSITIAGVHKGFGSTPVLKNVDLAVERGEFVALLGPSGCGKTTLLRLIAGLEKPDGGEIMIGEKVVAGPGVFIEPEDRRLGMVFQSFALWPTMTVAQNVAFGLRLAGMNRSDRDRRVVEMLALVGLPGMDDRRPHQLSGGQRQRAALARSLAMRPSLILLDEPLASLDANLRTSLLAELRSIHARTGTTFVLVTHDQSEAMAAAQRVVVMSGGRIEQVDRPEVLYAMPRSEMVARFVGEGLVADVDVMPDRASASGFSARLGAHLVPAANGTAAGRHTMLLRPGQVRIADGANAIRASVRDCHFRGADFLLLCQLPDVPEGELLAVTAPAPIRDLHVSLELRECWLIPPPQT